MKRSRFSDEHIIGILREHQAGLSAADLCRKHGISDAPCYKWRAKYGGMDISDTKRLKTQTLFAASIRRDSSAAEAADGGGVLTDEPDPWANLVLGRWLITSPHLRALGHPNGSPIRNP